MEKGKTDRGFDLSEVHPAFVENTRKRVRAILDHLDGDRSQASLERTAKKMNLSPSRTGRLIRSFEIHRDPKLVSADGRRGARAARNERVSFWRSAIEEAITMLGTEADARDIEALVVAACEKVSFNPPSTQSIWKALMKARRSNRSAAKGVEPGIVVGRLWLQIPVAADGGVCRPEALVALRLPDKAIRGCVTDLRAEGKPVLADLLREFDDETEIRASSIEIGRSDYADNPNRIVADDAAQSEFIRHLGNGIGELEVLFRRPRTDATTLLARGPGRPLSVEAARAAIRMALLRHDWQLRNALVQSVDGTEGG